MFGWFHKKPVQAVPQGQQTADAAPEVDALRHEVVALYRKGVNPIHAVRAMMHELDGSLSKDFGRAVAIWLGINELLDLDGVDDAIRGQLVGVREALGKAVSDTSPEAMTFVENYMANTRRINEMKCLQAYQAGLFDSNGIMQLEAVTRMIAEIEHERATNPGSRAQDISAEAMERLYALRDSWDDPDKLR